MISGAVARRPPAEVAAAAVVAVETLWSFVVVAIDRRRRRAFATLDRLVAGSGRHPLPQLLQPAVRSKVACLKIVGPLAKLLHSYWVICKRNKRSPISFSPLFTIVLTVDTSTDPASEPSLTIALPHPPARNTPRAHLTAHLSDPNFTINPAAFADQAAQTPCASLKIIFWRIFPRRRHIAFHACTHLKLSLEPA